MRRKLITILTAGMMMAAANVAIADHHEGGNAHWELKGKEGHLGAEYRFELTHMDNNFESGKDIDATQTAALKLHSLNITFDGRLNKSVTFDANVHMVGSLYGTADATTGTVQTMTDFIHWAYIDHQLNNMITIRGGRDFVNYGGFDNDMWGTYEDMLGGAIRQYNRLAPQGGTADLVEVMIKAGGWISLQLVNDANTTTTAANNPNNVSKQPAFVLEYKGQFGAIHPLVQIGSVDLNEEMFFTLGVKFQAAGLMGYLDYVSDNIVTGKSASTTGKETTDTVTGINLRLDYSAGDYTPFLKVTTLDRKQDGTDVKVNGTVPSSDPSFGDNAMHWALGVKMAYDNHNHYNPYLVIINRSGKFTDTSDGNKEVTASDMMIKVGVMGEF